MEKLLKNKRLATYILTVLIVFQIAFLFLQFLFLGKRSGLPRESMGDNSSFFPFFLFFIFIPSILLSNKKSVPEEKRTLLIWGLVILAAVVLSLMVVVLAKAW